jgi:CubicO group peptidase (beta-lactamase class C family)
VRFPISVFALMALVGATSADADGKKEAGLEGLSKLLPSDGEGVAIQATQAGKVLFREAFGLADREAGQLATPDTIFRIGSVSKQFTAVAILRLAEEGKLSLDDPLTKYFPGWPQGDAILLRHLLNHRSGLANYTSKPDFMNRVTEPVAPADLIASFRDDPPDFPPGSKFAYCNTGYFLLGEIVARVSGLSFGDYLRTAFFEPLGMRSTGVFRNDAPPPGAAKGYSFSDDSFVPAVDWDMSRAGGAGALYSTVGDLCLWTEALHGGKVLKPESLALMLAVPTEGDEADGVGQYGMGLYHSTMGGLPVIEHSGGLHGFASRLSWFPDQKLVVAVLANALPPPPDGAPAGLVARVARALLGEAMKKKEPRVDPTIDPATFAHYVGRYDYRSQVQEISVENGRIFGRLTGQKRYEIFPSGPDAFFYKVVDAQMQFLRNPEGVVVAVRHQQNGVSFRADRIEETVVVPESDLEKMVGRYQYGPLSVLTISRDGLQLFAQLSGQPKVPIFAETTAKFVWRIVPASVEFQRNPEGEVSGVLHTQNGMKFFAPKLVAEKTTDGP